MVYHLKHWAQVRDFCEIYPTWTTRTAFVDNPKLKEFCPVYNHNEAFKAAVDCSKATTQEGFEACLLRYFAEVCKKAHVLDPDLGPKQVDEYFKAWDRAGEEIIKDYEEHDYKKRKPGREPW